MKTLTEKEFKEKYGVITYDTLDDSKKEEGLFSTIKGQVIEAFKGGVSRMGEGIELGQTTRSPVEALESGVKFGEGAVQAVTSPLAPITAPIGKLINKIGGKLAETKPFRDIAESPGGDEAAQETGRILEGISGVSTLAGIATGPKAVRPAVQAGTRLAGDVVKSTGELGGQMGGAVKARVTPIAKSVSGAVRDVIPTKQNLIDESVAGALDLTARDLIQLEPKAGYSVTNWMADNNLIGANKASTQNLVQSFFDKNYKGVREEVSKVTNEYKLTDIPRYYDALKQIKNQVDGVPGLEKVAVEVENLMNKTKPVLADVQRAKELLDEHFTLYRKTGDVAEGVTKKGIANMRDDIKSFIESEVKKNTGADIASMNQSVSTSKGLLDAIENRSTRGVTRNMVSSRDALIGLGLFAGVNPVVGVAYVFIQKLINTPSARLRFARWLDTLGDKERQAVNDALLRGDVPKEAQLAADGKLP